MLWLIIQLSKINPRDSIFTPFPFSILFTNHTYLQLHTHTHRYTHTHIILSPSVKHKETPVNTGNDNRWCKFLQRTMRGLNTTDFSLGVASFIGPLIISFLSLFKLVIFFTFWTLSDIRGKTIGFLVMGWGCFCRQKMATHSSILAWKNPMDWGS